MKGVGKEVGMSSGSGEVGENVWMFGRSLHAISDPRLLTAFG